MSLTFYDPSENTLSVAGVTLGGITRISLRRGNVTTKKVDGIHEVYSARVKMNRKPFLLSITMLQTSPSLIYLEQLLARTERSPDSFFEVVLTGNGGIVHIYSTGYIETGADCDLEEALGERTWTICVNPYAFGGLIDLLV